MSGGEKFDVCEYCCKWCKELEGKSPARIRDEYPRMMRKVLKHEFGLTRKGSKIFVDSACEGNWERLHETSTEKLLSAETIAGYLTDEVFYFSDRWSWDRVMRAQWLYKALEKRCERMGGR